MQFVFSRNYGGSYIVAPASAMHPMRGMFAPPGPLRTPGVQGHQATSSSLRPNIGSPVPLASVGSTPAAFSSIASAVPSSVAHPHLTSAVMPNVSNFSGILGTSIGNQAPHSASPMPNIPVSTVSVAESKDVVQYSENYVEELLEKFKKVFGRDMMFSDTLTTAMDETLTCAVLVAMKGEQLQRQFPIKLEAKEPLEFRKITCAEAIPPEWRLATYREVQDHWSETIRLLGDYDVVKLDDGYAIGGKHYFYNISKRDSREVFRNQLVVRKVLPPASAIEKRRGAIRVYSSRQAAEDRENDLSEAYARVSSYFQKEAPKKELVHDEGAGRLKVPGSTSKGGSTEASTHDDDSGNESESEALALVRKALEVKVAVEDPAVLDSAHESSFQLSCPESIDAKLAALEQDLQALVIYQNDCNDAVVDNFQNRLKCIKLLHRNPFFLVVEHTFDVESSEWHEFLVVLVALLKHEYKIKLAEATLTTTEPDKAVTKETRATTMEPTTSPRRPRRFIEASEEAKAKAKAMVSTPLAAEKKARKAEADKRRYDRQQEEKKHRSAVNSQNAKMKVTRSRSDYKQMAQDIMMESPSAASGSARGSVEVPTLMRSLAVEAGEFSVSSMLRDADRP